MKIIKIKEEHYNAPLSWVTECSEEEFIDLVKRLKIESNIKLGSIAHFEAGNGFALIWVDEKLAPLDYLKTLNHELLHYCIEVLYQKGISIEYENDEVIAYFQGKMLLRCLQHKKCPVKLTK